MLRNLFVLILTVSLALPVSAKLVPVQVDNNMVCVDDDEEGEDDADCVVPQQQPEQSSSWTDHVVPVVGAGVATYLGGLFIVNYRRAGLAAAVTSMLTFGYLAYHTVGFCPATGTIGKCSCH